MNEKLIFQTKTKNKKNKKLKIKINNFFFLERSF